MASKDGAPASREWHCHPELPIQNSPLFAWPPQPVAAFKWLGRSWLKISERLIFALIAVVVWLYVQPPDKTLILPTGARPL